MQVSVRLWLAAKTAAAAVSTIAGLLGITREDWLKWLADISPSLAQSWVWGIVLALAAASLAWDAAVWWTNRHARRVGDEPDWSLREAADYLRFRSRWACAYPSNKDCLDALGHELETGMKLGQVKCWGLTDLQGTPDLIPAQFWNGRRLNIDSLGRRSKLSASTRNDIAYLFDPERHHTEEPRHYYYLQVNQAAVRNRWPAAPWVVSISRRNVMRTVEMDPEAVAANRRALGSFDLVYRIKARPRAA